MLSTLGLGMLMIGFLFASVAGLWLLVVAFQQSVEWGLISTFVPFGAFVFVYKYWSAASRPFIYQMVGLGMMFLGFGLDSLGR